MNKENTRLSGGIAVVLLAVFCNILWGSAHPGIKLGYAAFSIDTVPKTLVFAGIRFLVAGLIVMIITAITDKRLPVPKKENVPGIFGVSFVYTAVQYTFFYIGLSNTFGTNSSIVNSTSTFIAVILSHFVYKNDKLTLDKILGTVIGFIGVLIITLNGGVAEFKFFGEGFIILSSLAFVLGSMLSKRISANEDAGIVAMYNLFFGGIILLMVGLLSGGKIESFSTAGLLGLIYLCFLSAGAYTIWTTLLKYNPLSKIAIYNFIIPISGTILSGIFLHENIFQLKYLLALVFVCLGIVICNKPQKNKIL